MGLGFGRRLPDTYFTEEIVASYLPKRELLCEALRAVGFTLSVPEGAYYIFTQYRGVPALSKMGPCAPRPHPHRTYTAPKTCLMVMQLRTVARAVSGWRPRCS